MDTKIIFLIYNYMSDKRHFTVVEGKKEHGLFVGRNPSSVARKVVSKLSKGGKKVVFELREITQGSKKKVYGPYEGVKRKLKEARKVGDVVYKYESVVKKIEKKGGELNNINEEHRFEFEFDPEPYVEGGIQKRNAPLRFEIIKKSKRNEPNGVAKFKLVGITQDLPYEFRELRIEDFFPTLYVTLIDNYYHNTIRNRLTTNNNRQNLNSIKRRSKTILLESLEDFSPKNGIWSKFNEMVRKELNH